MILPEKFYKKNTVALAKALLGTCLVHDSPEGRTVGRIVETEAYLSKDDLACHARRGQTARNAAMFGPPGYAYIYLIYGMYYCFNVVSAPKGVGEAVLVRALEPVEGVALMENRRGTREIRNLCSGPGKLMLAMGMGPKLNGVSLSKGALTLHSADSFAGFDRKAEIVTTRRIGITQAADLPLRFYLRGSHFASRRCIHAAKNTRPGVRK